MESDIYRQAIRAKSRMQRVDKQPCGQFSPLRPAKAATAASSIAYTSRTWSSNSPSMVIGEGLS